MSALDWSAPFDALTVGATFATRARAVTESDVAMFAVLTGDEHPQHTDREWAASSRFGERIAHGLLVLSTAAGLVPFDPSRVVALRRLRDVTFKRPVRLGESVRVNGRVVALRDIDAEVGLVRLGWNVLNQHNAVAARAEVEVLWGRGETAHTTPAHAGAQEPRILAC